MCSLSTTFTQTKVVGGWIPRDPMAHRNWEWFHGTEIKYLAEVIIQTPRMLIIRRSVIGTLVGSFNPFENILLVKLNHRPPKKLKQIFVNYHLEWCALPPNIMLQWTFFGPGRWVAGIQGDPCSTSMSVGEQKYSCRNLFTTQRTVIPPDVWGPLHMIYGCTSPQTSGDTVSWTGPTENKEHDLSKPNEAEATFCVALWQGIGTEQYTKQSGKL